ncbi:glycosyltransferase [Pedobacter sp. AW31-3R]|uniref:glycosyltransferase n=1 Tax=Pedobacter sp. AW31-3R TaxID=3445781 RepID=UPI003FA17172
MIFITIGTQEPFDRLIGMMDEIAGMYPEERFIAQVYESELVLQHMEARIFLTPEEYKELFTEARIVISHAGMGTILSALTAGKPIIVVPRIAALGEHRNEHQLATSGKLQQLKYVYLANNKVELLKLMDTAMKTGLVALHQVTDMASADLLNSIKSFINS